MKHYLVSILTASMLLGTGCGAGEESESPVWNLAGSGGVAGSGGLAGSGGNSGGSASSCTLANETRLCSCGLLSGSQTCLGSEWGQCHCFSNDDGLATDQGGQLVVDGGLSTSVLKGNKRGDIAFDWLRTPPSQGDCKPGRYEGTFECMLNDGTTDWGTVRGPVTIVLERPEMEGEYLEIADGNLDGYVEEWLSPIYADLEGRLDCRTSIFEAHTVNGEYLMISFMPGPFNGVLEGEYNRLTWHLSGEWHLVDDLDDPVHAGFNCAGPWSADYVGP